MGRQVGQGFILLLVLVTSARGQDWAAKMFDVKAHDFGSVARDARAEFEFVLTNLYMEDVHVVSARASCGCTIVSIKNPLLKAYEEGAIVATLNTRSYSGHRSATITVTIDKPRYATVALEVKAHIRNDIVFVPGGVELGLIDRGTAVDKTISVRYLGSGSLRIVGVKSPNPHLSGEIVPTGGGRRSNSYELRIHLDEHAPVGYIKDNLVLLTNDRSLRQVPVLVEGRVLPEVTVSPGSLFMGVVRPGHRVTKQVVLRAKKPFLITSLSSDGEEIEFGVDPSATPKLLHVIPVTFIAGEKSGKIVRTIRIETDLGEEVATLSSYAVVEPAG